MLTIVQIDNFSVHLVISLAKMNSYYFCSCKYKLKSCNKVKEYREKGQTGAEWQGCTLRCRQLPLETAPIASEQRMRERERGDAENRRDGSFIITYFYSLCKPRKQLKLWPTSSYPLICGDTLPLQKHAITVHC